MKLEEYDEERRRFYEREGYFPSFGELKNYLEGFYLRRPRSHREQANPEDEAQQPTHHSLIPRRRKRPWK